jgi:hypothetical protein
MAPSRHRLPAVILAALPALSCAPQHGPPPNDAGELACPDCNLIIIALTNVRKDHLGSYGYPRPTRASTRTVPSPPTHLSTASSIRTTRAASISQPAC